MNSTHETFEKYERKRSTKREAHESDSLAGRKGWSVTTQTSASKQKKSGAMRGIQRALKRMEIE